MVYQSELRRLAANQAERLARWLEYLQQPLKASDPSGEFSDHEQLMVEFASTLPSNVRPELLARGSDTSELNNSASQTFARKIKAIEPFITGVDSFL